MKKDISKNSGINQIKALITELSKGNFEVRGQVADNQNEDINIE